MTTPHPDLALLRVAVPSPLRRSFHYLAPPGYNAADIARWQPGIRIRVPFGRREVTGILLAVEQQKPDVDPSKLRAVLAALDDEPLLPRHLLKLCCWAADYYQHPIGEALHSLLPVALRQGRAARYQPHHSDAEDAGADSTDTVPSLSDEQTLAINTVADRLETFGAFLLDGITGSGKTEVYLQLIRKNLEKGHQTLVLVPEISLTPQTIRRFQRRLHCRMAVLHSGLTDRQRLNAWLMASGGEADIIIGTRSAVFTPMRKPGLIIVDEEHDGSFKQQDGFRYSARDLAVLRAREESVPVLLGSATPSLETLHNAHQGRYHHLRLRQRPGATSASARLRLLDTTGQPLSDGFAPELLEMIGEHLARGNQVLVFINRRGFAPVLQCNDCGWIAECSHCDANLTLHRTPPHLRCHHCDRRRPPDRHCPDCQSKSLNAVGLGTERSEAALQSHFPDTRIIRVDRDSTRRKDAMQDLLEEIRQDQPCILVGTQMLAKGHHFPAVTLVAVLDADSGLFSADFRGQEHLSQLLLQVAGRAGRAERPGEVVVQTRHAGHEVLTTLIDDGYPAVAQRLLDERRAADMPPFTRLALLRAEAASPDTAMNHLAAARETAQQLIDQTQLPVILTGPLPAPMERRAGRYRAQLMLRSADRASLQRLLTPLCRHLEESKQSRRVRWSVDVDPQDTL
ncbi:MAG: primosomal protein N' [Pseudohongiellaceae bacterium]